MGGWQERIWPGAFDGTLNAPDIYALWNHNPDFIIAAVADHTLRLTQDNVGLMSEMEPMDTQMIRDLVVTPISQGKVRKMSFAFDVGTAEWSVENGMDIREIRGVARLYDVSPVTYPAYPGTDISTRTLEAIIRSVPREQVMDLLRADPAQEITEDDCEAQGGEWNETSQTCDMPEANSKLITSSADDKVVVAAGRTLDSAGALIEVYRRRAGLHSRYEYLERKFS